MAVEELTGTALRVLKNFNAQDTVFKDKSAQVEELKGDERKRSEREQQQQVSTPITPKDFYWDQIVIILVSAILGLTALDVVVEFFRGSVVQCFTPTSFPSTSSVEGEDFTREQAAYVNNYCYRSVPSSEYYPVFIIVHGLLIVAPHYLWSSLFRGDLDFFFDLMQTLDRLRNRRTGYYDAKNDDILTKLRMEFSYKKKKIFRSYILKLFAQLAICIISIIISATVFRDFSSLFTCPNDIDTAEKWPLPFSVDCVYSPLRLLSVLQYANYVLIILAIFVLAWGLAWCFFQHTTELGAEEVADFSFNSCLLPKYYVPLQLWLGRSSWHLWSPRINNDLDFLVMKLFRTDTGYGQVFKDLQVEREIKQQTDKEHKLLHLFINVQRGGGQDRTDDFREFFKEAGFKDEPLKKVYEHFSPDLDIEWRTVDSIRNRLYGFMQFVKSNQLAVDISFGSTGCALILAWAFERVASVNFDSHFCDPEHVVHTHEYYTNITKLHCPEDLFVQTSSKHSKFEDAMDLVMYGPPEVAEKRKRHFRGPQRIATFIVVGPIDEESKKVTVNLLIEKMHTGGEIGKEAALLAYRPLKIGHKKTLTRFIPYKPPPKLFKRHPDSEADSERGDNDHEQVDREAGSNELQASNENGLANHEEVIETSSHQVDLTGAEEGSTAQTSPDQSQEPSQTVMKRKFKGVPLEQVVSADGKVSSEGISTPCSGTECIMEFKVYQYRFGEHIKKMKTPNISESEDSQEEEEEESTPSSPTLPVIGILKLQVPKHDRATNETSVEGVRGSSVRRRRPPATTASGTGTGTPPTVTVERPASCSGDVTIPMENHSENGHMPQSGWPTEDNRGIELDVI